MGKIRVTTLGDEEFEKQQAEEAKVRREAKKAKKSKEDKPTDEVTEVTTAPVETEEKVEKKKAKFAVVKTYSKKYLNVASLVEKNKLYPLEQAIDLTKKTSVTKFDGTVEAHVNLNKELFTKEKKTHSGSVVLPHGTGKKRIVAVADDALIEKVTKGQIDFDVLVAHPSMMPKLARVAKVLGPRGLMPSPKTGTVTPNTESRVKELEGGEINWKTEPEQPIVHQPVGKVSFDADKLKENIVAFVKSVGKHNVAKLTLSSTMGPGVKVDPSSV